MSKENADIVKSGEEMWSRGDAEGALALNHPDVVIYEPPSLPYGGVYHGVDGVQKLVQKIGENWEIGKVKIETFDGGGDTVFNWMRMPARSRKTGIEIELEVLEKTRMKDGKIIETKIFYLDTHAALKALGLEK